MRDLTRVLVSAPLRRIFRYAFGTHATTLALLCVLTMAGWPAQAADGRLASILIDANDGRVLESANADLPRYPASLTKMMTLYLTFEALDDGRFTLDQPLSVSARAAAQAPTKLGLRAGQTIAVESALLGLVTKSANDAAMVLAENLAGTEENFALRMTSKAHALGMSQTVFHNASGLPDPDQVTTARDMSTLALSLLHHYPHYYHYFSVREFYYSGRPIANHNRLLGVYEGVDGIKTGYTRAAGFNLVASAQRGDRRLIGVVLGAPTSPVRNAMMADLFDQAFRGDQQIQLASVSYYLNGGAALARNTVAGEIASARRQVAYAAPAVMSSRVATESKKRTRQVVAKSSAPKAACSGRGAHRCGAVVQASGKPVRVAAKAPSASAVKKASVSKASAGRASGNKTVAAANPSARPSVNKAKASVASSKAKPAPARSKSAKAAAPADATRYARR